METMETMETIETVIKCGVMIATAFVFVEVASTFKDKMICDLNRSNQEFQHMLICDGHRCTEINCKDKYSGSALSRPYVTWCGQKACIKKT
jgi:hypothetical protein